jgi:hypothetical protein
MAAEPANIIQLRELLRERFPQLPKAYNCCIRTGIQRIDDLLEGGLWRGALNELVSSHRSAGSMVIITTILRTLAEQGQWVALIDGADFFDPQPLHQSTLTHLLWIRCHNINQTIRAADLLLRDGNLPLVVMDLRENSAAELRKIPGTTWYRFQRVIEQRATAFLIVTPHPLVSGAQVRLSLENRFNITALNQEQNQLLAELRISLSRRRFLHKEQVALTG